MSQGLQQLIYATVRTYCAHMHILGDGTETTISTQELSSILNDNFYIFQNTYSIFPRQGVEISSEQIMLANKISIYCQLFFLLHEFSHILIAETLSGECVDCKEEEVLADSLALSACLEIEKSLVEIELVYLGCMIGMLTFRTLEQLQIYEVDAGYPSFSDRIVNLKSTLYDKCSDSEMFTRISNFASIVEDIFDQVDLINSAAYEDNYRVELKREIEMLLLKYWRSDPNSSVSVPDYEGFSMDMWELLMKGHYEQIFDVLLADAKAELLIINKYKLNSIIQSEQLRYLEAYNKYKLIFKFTHSLPDPLAQVFARIYEMSKQD